MSYSDLYKFSGGANLFHPDGLWFILLARIVCQYILFILIDVYLMGRVFIS